MPSTSRGATSPALLGRAKFENDDTEEYVEKLTTADLHILREAVPRRCIH